MTNERVAQGVYADFKIIKTRSTAQVVIEIPIESASDFIAKFGIPQPAREKWVAVALLNDQPEAPQTAQNAPPADDGDWCIRTMSMLLKRDDFALFLHDQVDNDVDPAITETIINAARVYVGIESRHQFLTNQDAVLRFKELYKKYMEYSQNNLDCLVRSG